MAVNFYDEETPEELYRFLSGAGFGMNSLFKWGYNNDEIIGAEFFKKVLAFARFPNGAKPEFKDITDKNPQDNVEVIDIVGTLISPDNKVLFQPAKGNETFAAPQDQRHKAYGRANN